MKAGSKQINTDVFILEEIDIVSAVNEQISAISVFKNLVVFEDFITGLQSNILKKNSADSKAQSQNECR